MPKVVEISKSLSLYLVSSLGRGKGNRSWVGFTGEGMLSADSSTSILDADDRLVGDALMIPYLIGSYMPNESNCFVQTYSTQLAQFSDRVDRGHENGNNKSLSSYHHCNNK